VPPPSPQGVYAGGVESASELVRRGEASPHDFMLLSGYSGWGPWQLQQVRCLQREQGGSGEAGRAAHLWRACFKGGHRGAVLLAVLRPARRPSRVCDFLSAFSFQSRGVWLAICVTGQALC
jgi:hypothetical protein